MSERVQVRQLHQETLPTLSDGDVIPILCDATGATRTRTTCRTGTPTTVGASASNQMLLAANTLRAGATIYNDSSSTLKLLLGTPATATSFTLPIAPGGYYEVPFGYQGQIDGIWIGGGVTGDARITELT